MSQKEHNTETVYVNNLLKVESVLIFAEACIFSKTTADMMDLQIKNMEGDLTTYSLYHSLQRRL